MIPQRVAIEGFLSYRNRVEFCFDGASIWMLTGKNGAGKSTVFDAITFALYGVHRGSGSKVDIKDLINRNCDRLAVEFDFLLGEDRYRVQRTVARKGGPTFQAWHLSGPNPPNRQRKGEQAIPGTDKERVLTEWVEGKLGLGGDAFKMAVLLEQGKSDALLSAKPAERHALLSQLVDLSRYEALAMEAKKRLAQVNGIVERNRAELATLPKVTPLQIADQEERVTQTKKQVDGAHERIEALQALKIHALRWGELQSQQITTRKKQQAMQMLIVEANVIQGEAQRLNTLQKIVPALQRIHRHSQSQAQHRQEAESYQRQALDLAAKVAQATPLVERSQSEFTRLEQEHEMARSTEYSALQKLKEMNTAVNRLDELERLHKAIASCDEKLRQFPQELDQQAEAAQREVDELITLRTLLPYAQRYLEVREAWRATSLQLDADLQQQYGDTQAVADALARANEADAALSQARLHLGDVQSQKAVAEHDLAVVREQIGRFEQVGTKPTCPYCGQPLSAEHLSRERARLEHTLADRQQAAESAANAEAMRLQALGVAEAQAKRCDTEHSAAQKAQRETVARCESAIHERGRLEAAGWQALEKVRASQEILFVVPQEAAVDLCFAQPEPTSDTLAQLNARVQGYETAQASFRALQQSVSARLEQRAKLQEFESQYRPLAEEYPAPRVQAIRIEYHAAESAQQDANQQVAVIAPLLNAAKTHLQEVTRQLQDAQKKCEEAQQKAERAEFLATNEQMLLDGEIDNLPAEWQELARRIDDIQLAQLQMEMSALSGAEARHQALREAQSQLAQVDERLGEIETELQSIPPDAQRPLEELRQAEEQARAQQKAGEDEYRQATNELVALQNRHQRIQMLSTEARAAEKRANHYTLIAKYLGRDYLQRFLLQQAESAIVERANEVLDHCSGGALSMELRPQNDAGGMQKAFDIMVENRATHSTQAKMLPAWLLSGSQRFRVAISLALAIGQYASLNGQGIESVIIDEGFGSLDRQGLIDMEEALRGLDRMIKRVILVSHQDDFAHAFPHRYAVWLEDGASQAGLAAELESEEAV